MIDSVSEPDGLQHRFVAFVRAFGLHRPEQTPCGAPVPVSEAHALSVLAEQGAMSQTDLSRCLGLVKSTVSRLVDQLERRGWVERQPSAGDARCRIVALTDAGRDLAADIAQRRGARFARLLEQIPEGDRATVLGALDTLVEAARASDER